MTNREIRGLATGVGSLPHRDADAALDLVFKYTPRIPFWPQLPKRNIREGMVAQFTEGLPCIRVSDKGIVFDPVDKERELEKFYERVIAGDVDYFKISQDFAQGLHRFYQRLEKSDLRQVEYIKCQITGPFSFAASLKDEKGVALLHNYELMQAISKSVVMKALWQINKFAKFGKKIIVFIDEPYLACFGSAYAPINRENVVSVLSEVYQGIKGSADRALLGVHCCGNTDWSIFTEVPGISIINFDAFGFLDRLLLYSGQLAGFFKRGGILAWGIVPTEAFSPQVNSAMLSEKLEQGFNLLSKKGIEIGLLKKRLLLTPSCGLGALSLDKAEPIFNYLAELSSAAGKEIN